MRKKRRWMLPVLLILVVLAVIALDERLTLRTHTVASPKLPFVGQSGRCGGDGRFLCAGCCAVSRRFVR